MVLSKGKMDEARPFYEEGGRAIGEMLCHDPAKESLLWDLVAGSGLWKRWYLTAFKYMWQRENPIEARKAKHKRYERKRGARLRADRLTARREAGKAKLTKPKPSSEEPTP